MVSTKSDSSKKVSFLQILSKCVFHKTVCAQRVLNILACLNNLWCPWEVAAVAKGRLWCGALLLSRVGLWREQYPQATENLSSHQNKFFLEACIQFCILGGYFTCYQGQIQHSQDSLASTCLLCGWEMKNKVLIIYNYLKDKKSLRFSLGTLLHPLHKLTVRFDIVQAALDLHHHFTKKKAKNNGVLWTIYSKRNQPYCRLLKRLLTLSLPLFFFFNQYLIQNWNPVKNSG